MYIYIYKHRWINASWIQEQDLMRSAASIQDLYIYIYILIYYYIYIYVYIYNIHYILYIYIYILLNS